MAKSKLRQEQEAAMRIISLAVTEAHIAEARRVGHGNRSEGMRILLEESKKGFKERRHGAPDRRQKRK